MGLLGKIWKYKGKFFYYLPYLVILAPYKICGHMWWVIAGGNKVKVDGEPFHINKQDVGLSKDLFLNSNREPMAQELLKHLKKGDKVLDIGANIGYYSRKISGIVGEGGKIYAVEPSSANMETLKKNVENINNVECTRLAIGDINVEKVGLNIHKNLNWSGFNIDSDKLEEVDLSTLDSFVSSVNTSPDFVRMDVEGYEYEIIKGAKETMKKCSPTFMIEVHSHLMEKQNVVDFLLIFKRHGYELTELGIDPFWYPNISTNNPINGILLWLWKRFSGCGNNDLLDGIGKVRSDIKIADLLANVQFLNGETPAFHAIFARCKE